MIEWMFVAVMCMSGQCDFIISNTPVTQKHCQEMKRDFLALPFKPEVTLAAAQCMSINTGEKI